MIIYFSVELELNKWHLDNAIPGVEQKMPNEEPGVEKVLVSLQMAMSVEAISCRPAAI
jgi:hypothetical protein